MNCGVLRAFAACSNAYPLTEEHRLAPRAAHERDVHQQAVDVSGRDDRKQQQGQGAAESARSDPGLAQPKLVADAFLSSAELSRESGADCIEVVGGPQHQVAGAIALEVGGLEGLQGCEEVVAQVVLDVARHVDDQAALEEAEDAPTAVSPNITRASTAYFSTHGSASESAVAPAPGVESASRGTP